MDLLLLASSAWADWLGPPVAPFFWKAQLFERQTWESLTFLLRMVLTLGGGMLILFWWRARRVGKGFRERTAKRIAMGMIVLSYFVYFDFFNPNVRYADYYHRMEVFLHYTGSKYFEQLSYTRIYECTAVAEIENGRGAAVARRQQRDLRTNQIKPTIETDVYEDHSKCKRFFRTDTTEGRELWESFKTDVAWFERAGRGSYWQNMQKDHGYSPPPVWTMTGKIFSSLGSADHDFFLKLMWIDPLLQAGIIAMFWWAFGWKAATVAAVFWGVNAPSNFYWNGGAFLRQDWIFLLSASMCLLRKRMFALGGAALAWSSLIRLFPVILSAGCLVIMAIHFVRHRRFHPDHLRMLGGAILAAGILVPVSSIVCAPTVQEEGATTPAVVEPWKSFASHIALQNKTPLTNHMGLETILAHDWVPSLRSFTDGTWRDEPNGRMRFSRNDNLDDPFDDWKKGRLDRFEALKPVYLVLVAGLMAWTVWALRRTKLLWVGQALSLALCMSLANVACYYFSMFVIASALVRVRPMLAPVLLVGSGASQILLGSYYWADDRYTAQSYLFFALGIILLYAYSRPFSTARLQAWLRNEPEPKGSGDRKRKAQHEGHTEAAK